MLQKLLTALSLCLIGGPLFALCNAPSYFDRLNPPETGEIASYAKELLYGNGTHWVATRNGKTLNIVGTIHVADPRLAPVMRDLQPWMTQADLILLEATPQDEIALQNAIQSDPTALFLPDGPTLADRLDDDTWQRLVDAAAARGAPAAIVAKLQPWYLMILLALPPCALAEIAAGERGLDHLIMQAATDAAIPMQALEPFDTLLKIFQDGTLEEQLEMLSLGIMDTDAQEEMLTAMRDSYFTEDIGMLMGLSRVVAKHIPGLDPETALKLTQDSEDLVLAQRNLAWMPVIGKAAANHDNILVAVGAAHLSGEQGLLRLLENDGWTLSRR